MKKIKSFFQMMLLAGMGFLSLMVYIGEVTIPWMEIIGVIVALIITLIIVAVIRHQAMLREDRKAQELIMRDKRSRSPQLQAMPIMMYPPAMKPQVAPPQWLDLPVDKFELL